MDSETPSGAELRQMKVWLLTTSEPVEVSASRLMRAGLLAEHLSSRGHEVEWWTAAFDHHTKRYLTQRSETRIIAPDRRIHFLHTRVSYRRNIGLARLINHARVAREFLRIARDVDAPDIIVCSYPTMEMAAAAIRYARPRRVPVVVDVRDLWPDIFASAFPRPLRRLRIDGLVLAPWKRKKARIFAAASAITATSPAYLEWATSSIDHQYGGEARVFPLAYRRLPALERARASMPRIRESLGLGSADVVVWFVGTFGRTYDLVPVLTAARRFLAEGRNIRFVLSGEGEMRAQWEKLAQGLSNVRFTGWLEEEALTRIAAVAEIGLLAYRVGAPQGLPNKLFEYMSLGIPVVSSLDGECRSFIEGHGIGLHYDAHGTDDLTRVLTDLCVNEEKRTAIGAAASELYAQDFDSAIVYRRFAEYLEHVAMTAATHEERLACPEMASSNRGPRT